MPDTNDHSTDPLAGSGDSGGSTDGVLVPGPQSVRRSRFGRARTKPFSPEEKEQQAVFQTQVLVAAAIVLLLTVWPLLKYEYDPPRSLPGALVVPFLVVILVGGLTGFAEWWMPFAWDVFKGRGSPAPAPDVGKWKARRRRFQPKLVYVLTALIVSGLIALVWKTGLAIESPYIPLVTAPAVFGVFVALDWRTAAALIAIVATISVSISVALPREPCHGCLDRPVPSMRLADATPAYLTQFDRQLRLTAANRPGSEAFLIVGLFSLALAGLIGIGRLQNDRDLKRRLLGLAAERDRLSREVLGLKEAVLQLGGDIPDLAEEDGGSDGVSDQRGSS